MEDIKVKILILSLIIYVINIPFGYWRADAKKFSAKWIFFIHAPIPTIILFRFILNIGFIWYSYPFAIASYFLGQFTGKKIANKKYNNGKL